MLNPHCEECGYSLRGLTAGQPCPECGHLTRDRAYHPGPHTAWSRSVFLGLSLMLLLTINAVSSVLVQPFEEVGGSAPCLNLPGPKLWAMPLLQRPIGHTPELPGIVGTRTAMLSLLAVWLITAPCGIPRLGREQALRLLTRWLSVITFGFAFGMLLAAQGLWPLELPPYRLLLVGAVELPCTVLLYLYLRRLSHHVPGRARRETFDRLVWLIPVVMIAAVVLLTLQWRWDSVRTKKLPHYAAWSAIGFGVLAMTAGVAATAAVASLAMAYFHASFPRARRWILGAGAFVRAVGQLRPRLTVERLQTLSIAAGAALLLIAMILGIDRVLWIESRTGVGGNMPFVNYPGPKFWASAAVADIGGRYTWEPLVTRSMLLVINLGALWLLTVRLTSKSLARRAEWLRLAVRWMPVVVLGVTFASVTATRYGRDLGVDFQGAFYSRFFAIVTTLGEVPTTMLLYAWLSLLAHELGRPRLATMFRRLAVVILLLVGTSMLMFVTSHRLMGAKMMPQILLIASIYCAATLGSAVAATGAIVTLARTALLHGTTQAEEAAYAIAAVAKTSPLRQEAERFDDLDEMEPAIG